jgi:hypothetical protein
MVCVFYFCVISKTIDERNIIKQSKEAARTKKSENRKKYVRWNPLHTFDIDRNFVQSDSKRSFIFALNDAAH